MLGHFHHLHAAAPRRLRRLFPPSAALLAHPGGVWRTAARVGQYPRAASAQGHRAGAREGHQGADDVYVHFYSISVFGRFSKLTTSVS